jgi:hypothetical protein
MRVPQNVTRPTSKSPLARAKLAWPMIDLVSREDTNQPTSNLDHSTGISCLPKERP